MSRSTLLISASWIIASILSSGLPLCASEVAVPHSTPRVDALDLALPIGQDLVKLVSKLGYDDRGRIVGEATIDGAAATPLGKLVKRGGESFVSITFRGVVEPVTLNVEGAVGSGAALVSYAGPKGKVSRVATQISLAATQGALPGTLDVTGTQDAKGKLAATGIFTSGLGNDPPTEGTLAGKLSKGTKLSFNFKNGRQKLNFKGVLQGDVFVGTLKLASPPAKETIRDFRLPAGFLLRFNPTVAVPSLTSDRARAQIGAEAQLDWTLRGVPTSVTLEPGQRDVTSVLSTTVVPFAAPPRAVDPRAVFKVAARDLVTTTEVSLFAEAFSLGGPGDGAVDRDQAVSIAPLPDGGLLVLGTFSGSVTFGAGGPNVRTLTAQGGTDIFLLRRNADRSLRFVIQVRSSGSGDSPRALTLLADGTAVITGAVEGTSSFDDPPAAPELSFAAGAGLNLFAAGYSPEGAALFALAAPDLGDSSGTAAAAYLDGSFLLAGFNPVQGNGSEIGFTRARVRGRGSELESFFSGRVTGPGDDQPTAVATFPDASGVIVGFFAATATFGSVALTSKGERDAFIARIDERGDIAFAFSIGGRGDDTALAVAALTDGSCVVVGRFTGEAQAAGATSDVAFTAEGGGTDEDVFIVRYNAKGAIEFATRAGGTGPDAGLGVAALGDGSAVVAGFFTDKARFGTGPESVPLDGAGGRDAFLARYSASGRLEHASASGGSGDDEASVVASLPDGTALVAGRFAGTAVFGSGEAGETAVTAQGSQDAFIARHDPVNYRLVELRPEGLAFASVPGAGPNPNHTGNSIAVMDDGSAWVAGSFEEGLVLREDPVPDRRIALVALGGQDAFIARVLADGIVQRVVQIGDALGSASAEAVAGFPDGGFVVTGGFKGKATFAPGVTLTAVGNSDMFLARYGADGSLVFAVRGGGDGLGVDRGTGLAVLADDREILLTGFVETSTTLNFPGPISNITVAARNRATDMFVARYNADGSPRNVLLIGSEGDDRGTGIATGVDESLWVTGRVDTTTSVALDEAGGGIVVLSPAPAGQQAILAHYDRDGALVVARLLGGPGSDGGTAVAATLDGGVLVSGFFRGEASFSDAPGGNATLTAVGGSDAFVARFRADASLSYVKGAGGLLEDEALGVASLPDGSALVTGKFQVEASFGEGEGQVTVPAVENPRLSSHSDVFLARYDAAGALVFARGAGGGGQDAGLAVAALPDGSAFLTGEVGTGTVGQRTGPEIVFGAGEANKRAFDDLEVSGFVIDLVRSVFLARYFPYGAAR